MCLSPVKRRNIYSSLDRRNFASESTRLLILHSAQANMLYKKPISQFREQQLREERLSWRMSPRTTQKSTQKSRFKRRVNLRQTLSLLFWSALKGFGCERDSETRSMKSPRDQNYQTTFNCLRIKLVQTK